MPKQEQDAAIKWFRRWLCNDTIVKDISISKLSAEKLQCTKTGQVTTAFRDKEMTLPQWNVQLAQQYTAKRKEFLSSGKEHIKSTIANLLGITLSLPKIEAEQTGTGTTPAGSYNKFIIHRAEQVPVPCIVFYPKNLRPSSRIIFELNEKGKNEIAANDSLVKSITDGGDILLLADLRGYGETTDPKEYNEQKYATKEYRNAMISLHIGNPLIGQRVIDIISILDFCNVEPDLAHHPVAVYANGTYGPAVLHAAYLDGRIVKVQLEKSIKSYEEFLMNPLQNEMYTNVLYGVLQYYDLPNLIEKIGVNKVQIR
jgi:hypothetical protein